MLCEDGVLTTAGAWEGELYLSNYWKRCKPGGLKMKIEPFEVLKIAGIVHMTTR
ncbi:MAG: hypothetical protein JNJ56_12900 [Ignavibacteria bacterium]|nr:hypothetical protein [Ignavibacteria bacterium]